jgi:hypothetical protein
VKLPSPHALVDGKCVPSALESPGSCVVNDAMLVE